MESIHTTININNNNFKIWTKNTSQHNGKKIEKPLNNRLGSSAQAGTDTARQAAQGPYSRLARRNPAHDNCLVRAAYWDFVCAGAHHFLTLLPAWPKGQAPGAKNGSLPPSLRRPSLHHAEGVLPLRGDERRETKDFVLKMACRHTGSQIKPLPCL